MVKSLVITGYGINCEKEMAHAYHLAGAVSKIVHLNDILTGKVSIHDFHILNFPGGFSFGDDLGAGKALAQRLKHAKLDGVSFIEELKKFIHDKKYVLGVCNGFQVMLKLGLVPAYNGVYNKQSATLWINDSGRFENRWVHIKVHSEKSHPFLRKIDQMYLPVRHGEGKIIYSKNFDDISAHIAAQYSDENGVVTDEYPKNPNGSFDSIAALTDTTGHVLGMMPHPEAYVYFHHHPRWTREKNLYPDGLKLFTNVVEHAREEGWK